MEFILSGDITQAARVKVEANSEDDAIAAAEQGNFSVLETYKPIDFKFDGGDEHVETSQAAKKFERKVELYRLMEDNSWDTIIVDIDYEEGQDVDKLIQEEISALTGTEQHRKAILIGVYNNNLEEKELEPEDPFEDDSVHGKKANE